MQENFKGTTYRLEQTGQSSQKAQMRSDTLCLYLCIQHWNYASLDRNLCAQPTSNAPPLLFVRQNQPLLWIIDTAPIVLGALAGIVGAQQDLSNTISREKRSGKVSSILLLIKYSPF